MIQLSKLVEGCVFDETQGDQSWNVGEKNWKWRTLRHHGVVFPSPYEPHGVKMLYDGKPVDLTPEQEELATFFARYINTYHTQKPLFVVNFFNDFKKVLGSEHIITDFSKCDFNPIFEHLNKQKELRLALIREEKRKKEEKKEEKEAHVKKYGFAMVDNRREKVGNYMVEPPGLFVGRGDHPKMGMVKHRLYPEDIVLNLDEDAPIPECPVEGHKWGGIVHNHEVMWLACWRQNIGIPKYAFINADSSLSGRLNRKKFEVSRRLQDCIKEIRKTYMEDLESEDTYIMQRATAMWVIDRLGLRVGNTNTKGDDETDTFGCCSLCVEHVKLHQPNKILFDFVGKDSLPYFNTVKVDDLVFSSFKKILETKKNGDYIFDCLNPVGLNAHLSLFMPGLSAKVLRTYNASHTMQKELMKYDEKKLKYYAPQQKLLFFNRIIREAEKHKDEEEKKNHPTSAGSFENEIVKLEERIERLDIGRKEQDTHLQILASL
eukprot:TRINITY_DN6875_c0_g1_i1.p1 TRINITY_DN6875_c0_g1~~TRINITY_DN6875_c0_g1_i1.p1  ORF type:complete len:489 (+),score=120.61 TRINITY_DN6875_c0_g1_i1:62-1528(+)